MEHTDIFSKNSTFIFKVVERTETYTKMYICNRSSKFVEDLFFDKYVKWFEIDKMDAMYGCNLQILDELPYDNFNHRHQKQINVVKRKYIEEYSALDENSNTVKLCNSLFNTSSKNFRKIWKDNYNIVFDTIRTMSTNEIYNYIKQIWFSGVRYMLVKPRHVIFSNSYFDIKYKVVMLVFKPYLCERMLNKHQYPFDIAYKNKIPKIIDTFKHWSDVNSQKMIKNYLRYN